MKLICGSRQSGRTTKLIELLQEETVKRGGGRALMFVESYEDCRWADVKVIESRQGNDKTNVVTKPWSAHQELDGQHWTVVGADLLPPAGWTFLGPPIPEFVVIETPTPLHVVEIPEFEDAKA